MTPKSVSLPNLSVELKPFNCHLIIHNMISTRDLKFNMSKIFIFSLQIIFSALVNEVTIYSSKLENM